MADFQANIRAVLDTSGIERQITNEINNRRVNFSNITVNTANLVQQIQNELNNHNFVLNINGANIQSLIQNMGTVGQNAGQQFAHQFNVGMAELTTEANNADNTIRHMQQTLANMKLDRSSIDIVTQDLEHMNIAIERITTQINNNALTIRVNGIDEMGRAVTIVKQFDYESGRVRNVGKTISQEFDTGERAAREFANTLERANTALNNGSMTSAIDRLTSQFHNLLSSGQEHNEIHAQLTIINNDLQLLNTLRSQMADPNISDQALVETYQQFEQVLARVKNNINSATSASRVLASSLQIATLDNKMDSWLDRNTRATKNFGSQIQDLRTRLMQLQQSGNATVSQLKIIENEFNQIKIAAERAGQTGQSFATIFTRAFQRVSNYISSAYIIYQGINSIRQMYKNVLDIDTSLTGLYRVTNLSAQEYSALYKNMTDSAQEYGATLNDIIDGTTTWVKLGFEANVSERLSEITAMYQHVTDLDVETATKNLVTAYKGFQSVLDAEFDTADKAIERIADIYDKLGNEYAVSAANVGAALSRSASALQLAGASIEQAAGMSTGIAEVTQDAEKAGNALKVVSLRIRGMKGELEELGEDVDENVESFSKMQTHILNLTHGAVNIFNDDGSFKNIYEIMQGIAKIYYDLSDTEQADLLETVAGKHRANDIAALISNWSQVESATESAYEAAGTASKEQDKYMESMQGHLNQLQATWQVLSNSFLDSGALKNLIDLATKLLSILNESIENIGTIPTILFIALSALSFKNVGRTKMFVLKMVVNADSKRILFRYK